MTCCVGMGHIPKKGALVEWYGVCCQDPKVGWLVLAIAEVGRGEGRDDEWVA